VCGGGSRFFLCVAVLNCVPVKKKCNSKKTCLASAVKIKKERKKGSALV
jgi:hypothetical protein